MRITPNQLTILGQGLFFAFCILLNSTIIAQNFNEDFLFEKGVSAQQDASPTAAEEYFSLVIKENPNYTDAYFQRSKAYIKMGKYHKAIDDLKTVIHENPYDVRALDTRGQVHYEQKNYEKSLRDFQKVLQFKKSPEAYLNVGLTLQAMEMHDDAILAFTTATEMNPLFAEAYCGIADSYIGKGEYYYSDAMHYFAVALQYKPQDYITLNNRGKLYMRMGDYDRAILDFEKSSNFAHDFEAYLHLAQCYLEKKKWREAHLNIGRAVDLNKNHPEVYFTLGLIETTTGKYEDALSSFWAARGYDSDNTIYIKQVGIAEYNLGESYDAIETFNEYLDMVGTDEEVEVLMEKCYAHIEQMNMPVIEKQQKQNIQPSSSRANQTSPTSTDDGFTNDLFDRYED